MYVSSLLTYCAVRKFGVLIVLTHFYSLGIIFEELHAYKYVHCGSSLTRLLPISLLNFCIINNYILYSYKYCIVVVYMYT